MEKLKSSHKMAILTIFMRAKRPTERNGAVRFFCGTEGSMSNIAHKKFQWKILYQFLVIWISILIYNTKRVSFEEKRLDPCMH